MKISLCIIVKNEGENIQSCIESFSGIFKELIIVDTGSTDKTKKIALELGANVYDFEWIDDFSAARNFALKQGSQDFLMVVDADDRIKAENKKLLIERLNATEDKVDGVFLPYQLPIIYKGKRIVKQSYFPRIWRRSLGIKYKQRIHEYLEFSEETGKNFITIEIPTYTTGDFSNNFNRNLRILKKAVAEEPENARYIYYLGHDNQYSGNYGEAIKWYERLLTLSEINKDELCRALTNKGACHLKFKETAEAKKCFENAVATNSKFIEAHLYLGDIAAKQEDYTTSTMHFADAANCKPHKSHVHVNHSLYGRFAEKKYNQSLKRYQENA